MILGCGVGDVWVVAVAVCSVNFWGLWLGGVFWVCTVLPGISVFGVRFCVRWTTLLYMIGSERGVSGVVFGGRGVGSAFLVYPPLPLR